MSEAEMSSILEFSTDVSEAERPPLLPMGEYTGEIRGAEVKEGISSGKKYVAVQFYISPDEFPADFDASTRPDGVVCVYRRVPGEDDDMSKFRLRKFMDAIGAKAGKAVDVNEWVGLSGRVRISHSEYDGEQREEILSVAAE